MTAQSPRAASAPQGATRPQDAQQTALPLPADPFAFAFLPGTRVLTMDGAIPVEHLSPGDRVVTRDRGAQRLPGLRQTCVCPEELALTPIHHPLCIKAGSLGPNLPLRDCYLSPRHRLLVQRADDDRLVNPLHLVDGATITRDHTRTPVIYVQLAFARPEVIYAEGLQLLTAPPGMDGPRRTLSRAEAKVLA